MTKFRTKVRLEAGKRSNESGLRGCIGSESKGISIPNPDNRGVSDSIPLGADHLSRRY